MFSLSDCLSVCLSAIDSGVEWDGGSLLAVYAVYQFRGRTKGWRLFVRVRVRGRDRYTIQLEKWSVELPGSRVVTMSRQKEAILDSYIS